MNDTVVITSIYQDFWGTKEFKKSCDRTGLPVHNAWKTPGKFTGHADSFKYIYTSLLELKDSYQYAIYADGADSLVLKPFISYPACILYSTEKAIWEPTDKMKAAWKEYYEKIGYPTALGFDDPYTGRYSNSPWKYLNGGGWYGLIPLLIEFFDRYRLNKHTGNINAQNVQAFAFLKAQEEGFPIFLDTQCRYFQTTGFEDPGDFQIKDGKFKNLITETEPHILHGNGRTDMKHLYEEFNK